MTPSLPSFHDGWLTGIAVSEGEATLALRTVEGADFSLRLSGLEVLRADGFREGNIVLRLEALTGPSAAPEAVAMLLDALYVGPHPAAAAPHHADHAARRAALAERVAAGEAVLVNLLASYGCELVALCARVALEPQARSSP